jgi:multidrug efflux system outer membrane protein
MPWRWIEKSRRRGWLLAMLVACCTGCSLDPPFERPPLPVASSYPVDAPIPRAAELNAPGLDWQDYFTDPGLRALIADALDSNRDLRIAVLRVQEARSLYGIQRSERFPTVGLGASGSRSRTPADLSLTGRPVTAGQYQAGLGISAWELDFWGRIGSLEQAALESYLATDEARRAVELSIVTQVADIYFQLRELDERALLTDRTIETRNESLRIFTRRFQVGSTSRFDLEQVQALASQAQTLGAQLDQSRAETLHALTRLVGRSVVIPPATTPFDEHAVVAPLRPGLPSDLLVDRPDIMAAEHQLRAANANIGAARAAFFPRITLTANAGTASAELSGLFKGGSGAWSFAPALDLPIFDAGRRQANLDLAKTRREIAVSDYERTIQNAFRDVSDALAAQEALERQVRTQTTALAAQSERARLAKLRYDNGSSAFLEVLDAQRDLLASEQDLVQRRRAWLSSRVALYSALGGGSRALSGVSEPEEKARR